VNFLFVFATQEVEAETRYKKKQKAFPWSYPASAFLNLGVAAGWFLSIFSKNLCDLAMHLFLEGLVVLVLVLVLVLL